MNLSTEEIEGRLLSALLIDGLGVELIADCLTGDDFSCVEHRSLFQAISDMVNCRMPVNLTSVTEHMQTSNSENVDACVKCLNALSQFLPTVGNIARLGAMVKDRSLQRELAQLAVAGQDVQKTNTDSGEPEVERQLIETVDPHNDRDIEWHGSAFASILGRLEARALGTSVISGVQTGLKSLDLCLDGFQPGELAVVGGRPSSGKSSFVMGISIQAAVVQKLTVLHFSFQLNKEILIHRMFGSAAGVDNQALKQSSLDDSDWDKLPDALDAFKHASIHVYDVAGITVSGMRSVTRRSQRMLGKIGLIVVDSLQLVNAGPNSRIAPELVSANRTHVLRELKLLANEMQCPVILTTQICPAGEQHDSVQSLRLDLRAASGEVDAYADTIIFINHVDSDSGCNTGVAEIVIDKRNTGPTGVFKHAWLRNLSRFEEI